jgi:hypothetical protein
MALFKFKCKSCAKVTRKILAQRPKLDICQCGGELDFITNVEAQVLETFDNGIMPKKVERLRDIQELVKDHASEKKEPGLV